ncbi:hypothetical protein [Adhaeribacter arboris]|nr:hypothetical protein [Adhaeribacter arboris]
MLTRRKIRMEPALVYIQIQITTANHRSMKKPNRLLFSQANSWVVVK